METHEMQITQNAEFKILRATPQDVLSVLRGRARVEHYRCGKEYRTYDIPNGIVNVGKNKILDEMFFGATQIPAANWFIGLVDLTGFSALAAADTMASHSGWQEFTAY